MSTTATTSFWSNLIAEIAALPSNAAGSVSTVVSSLLGSHFASLITQVQALQNLGPGADAGELGAALNTLTSTSAQVTGTPQGEFGLIAALRGLVGKTDPTSLLVWGQICTQMLTLLNSSSSSLLGAL